MAKYFLLPHVGQFFNTENEILREKKSQNDGCGGNMKKKAETGESMGDKYRNSILLVTS